MKKIVFWAMMTLGVVSLQSCDKDDDDRLQVSANLQEAFDTRYPNVSRVDWEQKGQFYEAEFVDNGYENKAWFTPDGAWVMTEYDLRFTQLPQAVQDAFKAGAYASWKVDDVDKIEKTDGSVTYVIEVESGEKEYELNKRFGEQAAEICDFVIAVGERQAVPIVDGLKAKGYPEEKTYVAKNLNDALAKVENIKTGGEKKIVLLENDLPDNY